MSPSRNARKQTGAPANPGCVDFIAYSSTLDGWLACGWIAAEWRESDSLPLCRLDFGVHSSDGVAILCRFPRDDVEKIGDGFVLFLPGGTDCVRLDLVELRLRSDDQIFFIKPAYNVERASEADAISRCLALLTQAMPCEARASLVKLLRRPVYAGQDTCHLLKTPVFLEIDSAILCPPSGLVLRGWFADPFRRVSAVTLRCGSHSTPLDPAAWVSIVRSDVAETFADSPLEVPRECGFLVMIDNIFVAGAPVYLEIETRDDEVGFKSVPAVRTPGLRAIKDLLSVFDLRREEMVRAYDQVIGPAVAALNAFRLAQPPDVRELVFGEQPARPACSIVVPLYGRIDFMEYQLAFFSRTLAPDYELIYVLDDPMLLRATENLATSCLARFDRPFRLLALGANLGYGPASNIGLMHARAESVCFLNSDVFPKHDGWLDDMLSTLTANPQIGIVGALLLYEDETIQHEGCSFARLDEFGGWKFCLHPNKGRSPAAVEGVRTVNAVTGACLLMRTELARVLGGFDEGYVIGDFEDADLCRRVQEQGLICVVDRRAQLYHLERQSQGLQEEPWRLNLTLYNAWRFQRQWEASSPRIRLAREAAQ